MGSRVASRRTAATTSRPRIHVLGVLDDRRQRVETILPELRSMYARSAVKPRLRFFEGRDGINSVLYDTLSCRSRQRYGILSMADLLEVPGRAEMEKYIALRIAKGVHLRVVRSREKEAGRDIWPTSPADLRELRWAPEGIVFTMTAWTYDEKGSIISSRREHFGMIVESPEFSTLMHNLFTVLRNASTPA